MEREAWVRTKAAVTMMHAALVYRATRDEGEGQSTSRVRMGDDDNSHCNSAVVAFWSACSRPLLLHAECMCYIHILLDKERDRRRCCRRGA